MVDQMSVNTTRLVEVLQLLSLESEAQTRILPPFVDVPDELALLFGDQFDLLVGDELERGIGAEAANMVGRIDAVFATMAGNPAYFSMDALRSQPEWISIRELSRGALRAAGIEQQTPTLDWVTYVRGD